MTCTHEPEDTVGPVAARHCRHCGAEIVPAVCEECAGDGHVDRYPCPECDATGHHGWGKA
jgi:DnaJ-class molecular chaperone